MTDPYQQFIEAISADPAFPPDVVCTPLYAKGRVNFKRAKTDEIDQWQLAIDIDLLIAEAVQQIITQHERARDRIMARRYQRERSAAVQAIQEGFRQKMQDLNAAQHDRLTRSIDEVTKRHSATKDNTK